MHPASKLLSLILGATIALGPEDVAAQRLRERVSQLFVFGAGQEPLFLAPPRVSTNDQWLSSLPSPHQGTAATGIGP